MCNVCNSCNTRNTCACNQTRNGLCNSLWNLLFGYCVGTTNTNANNGCCCCQCTCKPINVCRRNTCCFGNNGTWGGSTFIPATENTATTGYTNGDLYYAYQYGLIPRRGGVCGNATTYGSGCGCNTYGAY
ncbi:MAG: hypothetical protein IJ996_05155 [Clostridia bacterium]|nr:hypothetical protein [Clostridia bacterium]